ncbi:hypothetical protein [Deinococcus yavapaiensis]|uniref:Repeat uncharacterized protein DUF346 n=1 Tax=Deinococcus yavapaiensis KR-236 TaxID=694435 RepID=A0A318S4V5_9DEIO|nr:hypothetical protein [Deinococcus yavapaiensis]PYE53643.1 repeat uncharacterized protein DUF346 [Deinococcus yavapaiensis KR-236]
MNKQRRLAILSVTLCLAALPFASRTIAQPVVPQNLEGGNLYVYAVGMDRALWFTKKSYGAWGGWQRLGGKINGSPDACSPNPGKILVMLRANDDTIDGVTFDFVGKSATWSGYGSKIGSDPGLACAPGDKVSLFVRGHNNAELYATGAENGAWSSLYTEDKVPVGLAIEDVQKRAAQPVKKSLWQKYKDWVGGEPFYVTVPYVLGAWGLGGQIKGGPEGVIFGTPAKQRQAVFVRGLDDFIWWRVTDDGNSKWLNFESLGGLKMTSDPTVVPWRNGGLLLFARGMDNKLWVREFRGGQQWTAWFPWGGPVLAGSPDATSWGPGRVDVFARGADGQVLHAWRDDNDVLAKEPKWEIVPNGTVLSDPTAVGTTW